MQAALTSWQQEVFVRQTPKTSFFSKNGVFFIQESISMATLKINNQDYDSDLLSEDAKAQLASVQFVDAELQRLSSQMAVLRTARTAYGNALQAALPVLPVGDTMKFN